MASLLNKDKMTRNMEKFAFRKALKELIKEYGYGDADKILIHIGENAGVKGGEIIKYF